MTAKRVLRITLWSIAALLGLLLVLLIYFSVVYSPQYVRRLVMWGQADVYDYERFPERAIQPGAQPFRFAAAADPAAAEARVRAAFEGDDTVGSNLDTFLQETGTQAFIVIWNDEIQVEQYGNGKQRNSVVTSFSMAKSFLSTLVAIAIAEGDIGSVDDPITDHLPELSARDPRFAQITIRHLLNMSSGIRYVETGLPNGDDALTYYFPDLRQLALRRTEISGRPGERWLYNNYHPLLLGLILERATGMPVAVYLQEKLWKPLGMEFPASWSLDSEQTGFEKMESGINARAIDFANLGRLYLHGGRWDGEQLIPQAWVQAATRIDTTVDRSTYYPARMEQPYGRLYHQLFWWGVQQEDGGYGFSAMGNHGQYVFVWPEKSLIIVRIGERYGIPPLDWLGLFTRASDNFGATQTAHP